MVRVSIVRSVERERDNRRLAAQQLVGPPAGGVVQVVDRLLAVQAQDMRAARLAVRARTAGLTAADVDCELEKGTLVVTWLNRGTLHLVRSQDYWWLQRLTTAQLSIGNARRLAQEGVSPVQADRGVAAIEAAIANDGPRTRAQLREIVAAAGVPVAGQALVHILFLSALRGLTVRGPLIGASRRSSWSANGWATHPGRPTARATYPGWPGASWPVTAPPMEETWPSGPVSPLATRVADCGRPEPTWWSAQVVWLTWLDETCRRTGPDPGCSVGSTRCCTVGSIARRS